MKLGILYYRNINMNSWYDFTNQNFCHKISNKADGKLSCKCKIHMFWRSWTKFQIYAFDRKKEKKPITRKSKSSNGTFDFNKKFYTMSSIFSSKAIACIIRMCKRKVILDHSFRNSEAAKWTQPSLSCLRWFKDVSKFYIYFFPFFLACFFSVRHKCKLKQTNFKGYKKCRGKATT